MKALNIIIFSLVLISIVSCKKDPSIYSLWTNKIEELKIHNQGKVTITKGIYGTLTLTEGNCMPAIGGKNTSCIAYPVKRKVRIYEYTQEKDAEGSYPFYKKVNTKLIATGYTDDEGFFQFQLQPSQYSIFIEEKGKLYASGSDWTGGLNPFTVSSGIEEINLNLMYAPQ
ncbi:MAG: hypothetical protein J7604_24755 [Sporocytophaga sp.]|uniref:hypothetical protein n=1 Tax=Sporocytophaga sp. TaxID=2231183 RepID=UPI001B03AA63|nr:hypothetical protein [Sporocytophaga sp.]MBO9703443.1 hypothetical protein [Sporocytophaga sp.]